MTTGNRTHRVYLPAPLNDLWIELYVRPTIRAMADVGRAAGVYAREDTSDSVDRTIRAMRALIGESNLPAVLSEGMKVGPMTILVAEIDRWEIAQSASPTRTISHRVRLAPAVDHGRVENRCAVLHGIHGKMT